MNEDLEMDLPSEHIKYYRSLIIEGYGWMFYSLFISTSVFLLTLVMLDENNGLPDILKINDNQIEAGLVFNIIGLISTLFLTRKNRGKAKSALSGNCIELNEPRWVSRGVGSVSKVGENNGYVLRMVHPEDEKIGYLIHKEFTENLGQKDVLWMHRVDCVSLNSTTDYWSMPKENYGGSGRSNGGAYSWDSDSEYHGSTTKYHVTLKLESLDIVFSNTEYRQWIKEGEHANVVVRIEEITDENYKVRVLKILN